MKIDAPSRFQNSFFQEKACPELSGLDLLMKRFAGKWKRRSSVLKPWIRIVEVAEVERKQLETLTDKEINRFIRESRLKVTGDTSPAPKVLALICEVSRRELGLTPYRVQMLSALALIEGYLAEIDTGEGKTLSIALAAAFEAWKGDPVHVITANDYLAKRN